jgi:hypothetical protein
MELADFINVSVANAQRQSFAAMRQTFQRLADAMESLDLAEHVQVVGVWKELLVKFCDEAEIEVRDSCFSIIDRRMIEMKTMPEAQEMYDSIDNHQTEMRNDARDQFIAACDKRYVGLSHQLLERFQVAQLRLGQDINQRLLQQSKERLSQLQEMVHRLEVFTENFSSQLRTEFERKIVKDLDGFETYLAMECSGVDFDDKKNQYLVEIETTFRDGCVQHQNDIEIHVAKRITETIDDLKVWIASRFSGLRQLRLTALETTRQQIVSRAGQELAIVQRLFIGKAAAEIGALRDDQIEGFVQRLIGKTDQYGQAAKTDFQQRLTPDEWKHIQDQKEQLQRRLLIPINSKLQEVTLRQKTIDQQNFQALKRQKEQLEAQIAQLEANLAAEKRGRSADRAALEAAKDKAVLQAKEDGKAEKGKELEKMKGDLNNTIADLRTKITEKDSQIQSQMNSLTSKQKEFDQQNHEMKRLRAKLRICQAYRGSDGCPEDNVLDFCISDLTPGQLDNVTLGSGNLLAFSMEEGCCLFSLFFGGSPQQFGRDSRPQLELNRSSVRFRYYCTSANWYYVLDSCPDICDACSGYSRFSYFTVYSDSTGFYLQNNGLSHPKCLRAVGGVIHCDGRDSNDASRLTLHKK